MAYRRFRYRRFRTSRYLRKPRYSRSVRTRRYRYRRRASRSTKSSIVKLSAEVVWQASSAGKWVAFKFSPSNIPGFSEYAAVYSRFRILGCQMYTNRTAATDGSGNQSNDHYLIVPSRTFARTTGPFKVGSSPDAEGIVPAQLETDLRQTKWQREIRPSNVRPYFRVGFKPYCMVGTYGPSSATDMLYYRVHELTRWTPMSWAIGQTAPVVVYPISCFGPYIVSNNNITNQDPTSSDPDPIVTYTSVLQVRFQFCGQK